MVESTVHVGECKLIHQNHILGKPHSCKELLWSLFHWCIWVCTMACIPLQMLVAESELEPRSSTRTSPWSPGTSRSLCKLQKHKPLQSYPFCFLRWCNTK